MAKIDRYLEAVKKTNGSDLHIQTGIIPKVRIHGQPDQAWVQKNRLQPLPRARGNISSKTTRLPSSTHSEQGDQVENVRV